MASLTSPSGSSIFANLPPPAECLAILVGFAEITIFGLAGLANPPSFAKGLGLPITSSSSSSSSASDEKSAQLEAGTTTPFSASQSAKTQRGLILALAARNLEKGLTVMAFACYWRDRKALGTCIFAGLLTTAVDYLAVKWYGEEEAAFGHVIGMANCSLIGGALLYWSRDGAW